MLNFRNSEDATTDTMYLCRSIEIILFTLRNRFTDAGNLSKGINERIRARSLDLTARRIAGQACRAFCSEALKSETTSLKRQQFIRACSLITMCDYA